MADICSSHLRLVSLPSSWYSPALLNRDRNAASSCSANVHRAPVAAWQKITSLRSCKDVSGVGEGKFYEERKFRGYKRRQGYGKKRGVQMKGMQRKTGVGEKAEKVSGQRGLCVPASQPANLTFLITHVLELAPVHKLCPIIPDPLRG